MFGIGTAFLLEASMYAGIGFLLAALLGLAIFPAVHGRAVRLTERRLDAAIPLSVKDMHAEKDQMRAKFAVATQQLESSIEHLKGKTFVQIGEIGRKTETINRLKSAVEEKSAAIRALEERESSLERHEQKLRDELRAARAEAAMRADALADAERAMSGMRSDIAGLMAAIDRQHREIATPTAPARDGRCVAAAAIGDTVAGNFEPRSTAEWLELGKAMLRPGHAGTAAQGARTPSSS